MQESKILGWDIEEIKELMQTIASKQGRSLVKCFKYFAIKTNRQTYSVRNFYYRLLEVANKDKNIAEILVQNGITNSIKTNHFTDEETAKLLRAILRNDKKMSVRKACFELADGDANLMMRYQNKYRNALKTQPELIKKISQELQSQNIKTRDEVTRNNIMIMPLKQQETITEKEIQSLFWGLVKLVKRSAEEEVQANLKREAEFANNTLSNALIDLRRKEMLIKELKEQNERLNLRLKDTEIKLENSQQKLVSNISKINDLAHSSSIKELKNFIESLKVIEKTQNK